MKRFNKLLAVLLAIMILTGFTDVKALESPVYTGNENAAVEVSHPSDVVWDSGNPEEFTLRLETTPLATYRGASGVTIRSYSSAFNDTNKLKAVYNELMSNTIGPEIAYLSYVDLVPNYSEGQGTAGVWHGLTSGGKLAKGRQIEIFGCDTISFENLANVLAHEYGHHFTYYHSLNIEGKSPENSTSGYYRTRNLAAYSQYNTGYHMWSPAELAAEDYKQLFGSPTAKKSYQFQDIRDEAGSTDGQMSGSYTNLMFNYWPQENIYIPLAWQVKGLYSYWTGLAGINPLDKRPPSAPLLTLTNIETFDTSWGKKTTATLRWTQSLDDTANDIEYTLVSTNADINDPYAPFSYSPIRTTTDSKGRDAIIGSYQSGNTTLTDANLEGERTFRVYAKDKDGNIVASNDIVLNPLMLDKSLTKVPSRIAGIDRYGTSANISKFGWKATSDTVILATGNTFPDALSAAPLAKKYNAPILLTDSLKLDQKVEDEITRLSPKNIIIIGGVGAVSAEIENYLTGKGYACSRIAGSDRFQTSLEICKRLGDFTKVVVVTGRSFPDALSIAPYAAKMGFPILLSDTNSMSEEMAAYLKSLNITNSYVIGGPAVVGDAVKNTLPGAERIFGSTRYETNQAIINKFDPEFNYENIYIATGTNFPDALSGSVLASMSGSPIVLTENSSVAPAKALVMSRYDRIKFVNFIGGDGVITNKAAMSLISNN